MRIVGCSTIIPHIYNAQFVSKFRICFDYKPVAPWASRSIRIISYGSVRYGALCWAASHGQSPRLHWIINTAPSTRVMHGWCTSGNRYSALSHCQSNQCINHHTTMFAMNNTRPTLRKNQHIRTNYFEPVILLEPHPQGTHTHLLNVFFLDYIGSMLWPLVTFYTKRVLQRS